MSAYELRQVSQPDGSFAAAWFDDRECLWDDDCLHRSDRLGQAWTPPQLRLHRPERGATPILFNPNAIAVSQEVRDELASFPEIEFLPILIDGHGMFFLFHVFAFVSQRIRRLAVQGSRRGESTWARLAQKRWQGWLTGTSRLLW